MKVKDKIKDLYIAIFVDNAKISELFFEEEIGSRMVFWFAGPETNGKSVQQEISEWTAENNGI